MPNLSRTKDKQKLKKKLDLLFGALIRERDKSKPCIDLCGRAGRHQAGHFRRRELMSTRYNYRNVNGQNEYCNNWGSDTYNHGLGIDKRYGQGWALELHRISRRDKQWEIKELEKLIEAAKKGYEEYCNVYDSITI